MNRNAHRKALAHKRAPEQLEPLSEEDRALAASFALPSEDALELADVQRSLSNAERTRRAHERNDRAALELQVQMASRGGS
jgi:hypothetical protein